MIGLFHLLLAIWSFGLLVLSGFLLLEVLSSFQRREHERGSPDRGPVSVIMPAHNEAAGIARSIAEVKKQLRKRDELVVVADNCTDDTAAIAKGAAAVVLERNDMTRRGKGYALQFALDHLQTDPPAAVAFVDADCRLSDGLIDRIARVAIAEKQPVQALYMMETPDEAGVKGRVSAFAWAFMNKARQSGLDYVAGVTRLTGSGMAMPWTLASTLNVASGEIVEDLALTITLTELGAPPLLLQDVVVTSDLPSSDAAATKQHARWEHGSLRLALSKAGPLLFRSVYKGDWRAAMLALDIAIPPLTLFLAVIGGTLGLAFLTGLFGHWPAFQFAFLATIAAGSAVFLGWFGHGREILPASDFRGVVEYALSKVGVYGAEARQSTKSWTRTDRGSD
jgi:glycosyltransferase involved in cell wall biosynthesis